MDFLETLKAIHDKEIECCDSWLSNELMSEDNVKEIIKDLNKNIFDTLIKLEENENKTSEEMKKTQFNLLEIYFKSSLMNKKCVPDSENNDGIVLT